jgi:endonuclease/exonuclease/phosphatase family metal-dependent hydrolase
MSAKIKVFTFNLRINNKGDGINMFDNRTDRILECINTYQPDLIGFQEVTDPMRAKLRDCLPDYTVQGCGRGSDYHGEAMLIAYRKDVVELISLENIWLSMTPTIPGSRYGGDQSGCPRMFTAVLLKHNDIEKPFYFINTHLDHEGATARYLGAVQLTQYISQHTENFVLTGDFNATPETPEIKVITEALAYRGATDCTETLGGTFHGFGHIPADRMPKIDYIFSDAVCTESYIVEDIPVEGQYYSDHNAVCAILEME